MGEVVSVFWHDSEKTLKADDATAKTYLINGHAPAVGEKSSARTPICAWTYKQIAAHGRDAFYKGAGSAQKNRCNRQEARWHDDRRRSRRLQRRMGRSNLDDISRLDRARTAAQWLQGIAALEMLQYHGVFSTLRNTGRTRRVRCTR